MSPRCTAEQFVRAWQSSNSRLEVMNLTGLTADALNTRARYYRKAGIKLKRLHRATGRPRLDINALNLLAESLMPKNDVGESIDSPAKETA